MENQVIGLVVIVFFVLALNFYFLLSRMRKDKRTKRSYRIAPSEREQSLWREKEIERRMEREQDIALERVRLRNETLALYDEVRRRAAAREAEGVLISNKDWQNMENDDIERFR